MLENRYYAITTFSNEWWINTIVTILSIFILLIIGKKCKENKTSLYFNYFISLVLIGRFFWFQWYHYYIGIWNVQWSLPLQMCSFSSLLSGILPLIENLNINQKYKQFVFEFLLYFSIGALYALITPVYTAGNQGLIYYEYYISHGGILFCPIYFITVLNYRPAKGSWIKVFLYSQILLIFIHIVNINIGGQANYFFTVEPPIANNPLVIGQYPMHIIMMDLFALIHFYFIFKLVNFFKK